MNIIIYKSILRESFIEYYFQYNSYKHNNLYRIYALRNYLN